MGALTFNGPYDWGYIIVGAPQTFNITYTITGPDTISDIVITLQTDVDNAIINGSNVVITPTSDWISPDLIKIQNAQYPAYQGDTSNQIITTGISDITDNYLDTLLYCFEFTINEPIEKVGSLTATATYTVTDSSIPPVSTQETETQIYTFTEQKNIDSAKATLEQLINIGISNQNNL